MKRIRLLALGQMQPAHIALPIESSHVNDLFK